MVVQNLILSVVCFLFAWALAILLAPVIGALMYFLVRRPRRILELGV